MLKGEIFVKESWKGNTDGEKIRLLLMISGNYQWKRVVVMRT